MNKYAEALGYLDQTFSESLKAKTHFYETHKEELVTAAHLMGKAILRGKKIILLGNGGSSSDALHMAGELTGRMIKERQPLPAIVIGSGLASLTAISNDYSYDTAFEREMKAFAQPGDFVIAISTSGNSRNVLNAVTYALKLGCYIVSLTGKDGGLLGKIANLNLCVSQGTNASRIQETHIFAIHSMVDLMDNFFLSEDQT